MIQSTPLCELLKKQELYADFFHSFGLKVDNDEKSFAQLCQTLPSSFFEEHEVDRKAFEALFIDFSTTIDQASESLQIKSLDVLAGVNKHGEAEACDLHLEPGEITCIVGPTGSGKSRLLADIEWLANADTPTKRRVLVNGQPADDDTNMQFGGKLIAQITQNMNFVLDMDVEGFLMLHAQSRFIANAPEVVKEVIALANNLSGESFEANTPVTFLSGGQSRALMIADVACIGQAPIVLIDEIENAGVNKKKALDLLVSKEKIVLMATHDPLLILLADKRVSIKNGGMHKIMRTNSTEKAFYAELELLDTKLQQTKDFFRAGHELMRKDEIFTQ